MHNCAQLCTTVHNVMLSTAPYFTSHPSPRAGAVEKQIAIALHLLASAARAAPHGISHGIIIGAIIYGESV